MAYRINSNDVYPDLDECRFPSREVAEEIADVVEHVAANCERQRVRMFGEKLHRRRKTEYCSLNVEEAEGEPHFATADEYLSVTWPAYPGPKPPEVSWEDWLDQHNLA